MYYYDGDITNIKGIRFKDTGTVDLKPTGHPCVIPIETCINEDYLYFLTMTSNPNEATKKDGNCILVKMDKTNRLRKPSYINLRHVYKVKKQGFATTGTLRKPDYQRMIEGIFSCCEVLKDQDYLDIESELIKRYSPAYHEVAPTSEQNKIK